MEHIKRYLFIILGNFMVSFGLGQIVLANGFVAGGVTGIGLIFSHFIPISVPTLTGIINTVLFIAGAIFLGKRFAVSTALSAVVFPIFLQFCTSFTLFAELTQDKLFGALVAAGLIGSGIGLIIRNYGSTGGVDVIALLINKFLKCSISKVMGCIDVTIIVLQVLWQHNAGVLYGLLIVVLTSVILNQTLIYGAEKVQVLAISHHSEDIRKAILFQCDTGATLFHVETGYEEKHEKALMTIVPYKNLATVKDAITMSDPNAFVIVSMVREVNGRGYSISR